MKYGPHTPLVEEVIGFVRGGGVLQSQGTAAEWHIIYDLDEAKEFAWELTIGPDEYLWTDLRALQMAEVKGRSYDLKGFSEAKEAITDLLALFTRRVRRQLDTEHEDLLDDTVADLFNCAFNRAVDGGASDFFEELFRAYRAGGWPCGWLGDHPAGRLVVYMRQ